MVYDWFPVLASTIVGVVVGAVLNFMLSYFKEERKAHGLLKKRRAAAYRRLKGLTDRMIWKGSGMALEIGRDELDEIESTLATECDVIEPTTLAAWDSKTVKDPFVARNLTVLIECEDFVKDVNSNYEKLRYHSPV